MPNRCALQTNSPKEFQTLFPDLVFTFSGDVLVQKGAWWPYMDGHMWMIWFQSLLGKNWCPPNLVSSVSMEVFVESIYPFPEHRIVSEPRDNWTSFRYLLHVLFGRGSTFDIAIWLPTEGSCDRHYPSNRDCPPGNYN